MNTTERGQLSGLYDIPDIILGVVLEFTDPFDMLKFMNSTRIYRNYSVDDNFWKKLLLRKYGINYLGDNPRLEYLRSFVLQKYNLDTKFRDLPAKYQWLAFVRYFTGENMPENFEVITRDDVQDALQAYINPYDDARAISRIFNIENLTYGYLEDLFNTMSPNTQYLFYSKNPIIGTTNWVSLGPYEQVTPETLFSLKDPLNNTLRDLFNSFNSFADSLDQDEDTEENETPVIAASVDTLIYYNLDSIDIELISNDIEYNEELSSHWDNNNISPQFRELKNRYLNIGSSYGLEDTLSELAFIINTLVDLYLSSIPTSLPDFFNS